MINLLGQDAYIGCFIDNRTARDLNKLPGQIGNVWIGSNSNMTVAACLDLCRGFSLPYAGLEFGFIFLFLLAFIYSEINFLGCFIEMNAIAEIVLADMEKQTSRSAVTAAVEI